MTTALVLAGGGSLGAVQVGTLRALLEAGVDFDFVVGTSVGAVNAAWVVGDPTSAGIETLDGIWRELRRGDVFPANPLRGILAAAGQRRSLVSGGALRDLLRRHLRFDRLEDAPLGLHVVAGDVRTGDEVLLSEGPAVEAVLASTAIPGILPPVRIEDRWYMDGGVVNNTPISHAVELGADQVWVLPAGYPCSLPNRPSSALGMALQGLTLLIQHRLLAEARHYHDRVRLRIAPPLCPVVSSPADFSHTPALIERGYRSAQSWLTDPDRGGPELLGVHPHPHG